MEAYIEVISDGTKERFPIEKSEVKLGRSGTADISIPASRDLELEHFLVQPRGKEGCFVSVAQGAREPTTVKGKAFTSGIVKWETEFLVGRTKVRVTVKKPRSASEGPSPIVVIGSILILAIGGYIVFSSSQDLVPTSDGLEPPELFTELDAISCDAQGREAQILMAEDEEHRGNSKADRYRYEASDGVSAVFHFTKAAACYRAVSVEGDAEDLERLATNLRTRISSDYATLLYHFQHSIEVKDWRSATSDAERLVALTAHLEDNEYREWLLQTLRIVQGRAVAAEEARDD